MAREFLESDWQTLRPIFDKALQRHCQRALDDLTRTIQTTKAGKTPHEVYLKIFKKMQAADQEIGRNFNDWRRSQAFFMVLGWVDSMLLTKDEFESLSQELKSSILAILNREVTFYKE